jgi:hypothetical protein
MYRLGPIQGFWWKFMPGAEIEVPWPAADIVVGPNSRNWGGMGPTYEQIFSTDPNDHYRPWLEENVGRQGWDWDWRIGQVAAAGNVRDTLVIKFRKGKAEYATMAAMRWS